MTASTLSREALVVRVCLTGLLAVAMSCTTKDASTPSGPSGSETRTITQYFAGATAVGATPVTATVRTGTPPTPGGGPSTTVASITQTADAGLNLLSIQGSAPFQAIYVSIGPAQSAAAAPRGPEPAWASRFVRLLDAPMNAATVIETTGFLQIDLPTVVTGASVILSYASGLPLTFEVRVQISAAGGSAGPAASIPKTLQTGVGLIELVGVVLSTFGPNPANPLGPGLYGPPVAGAVVSTSLDARTAVTNGQGAFDLLTDTPNSVGRCFWLTITAAGWPTYSSQGWIGSNKQSGGVQFTLDPPQPPDLKSCG